MKVLLIDFMCSELCRQLYQKIRSKGDECVIALAVDDTAASHIAIGNRGDRIVHKILANISDSMHMHSARATYNLLSRAVTLMPDIVHIVNIDAPYLNLPLLSEVLTRYRIPSVLTVNNPETLYHNTKALIKRTDYNIRCIGSILWAWETLSIVVPDREQALHPLLADKPTYIIDSNFRDATTQYMTLYYNIL